MARSRNIKPGFFTNDVLGELPALARLLFAGIWTLCDREGRIEDRPKKIKAEVLPYDECDADTLLQRLHDAGFIQRYQANGTNYIQVCKWAKHQNPHVKEAASIIPAPGEHHASTVQDPGGVPLSPERAGLIPDSLSPDSLKETGAKAPSSAKPTVPCPYQSIVDLYHQHLPGLPRVKLMGEPRKKAIRKVWGWVLSSVKSDGARRATNADGALEWLDGYFARAAKNDFLTGRTPRGAGHENWQCDLDFLLTDKGMKQVIEKTLEAA